MVVYWNNIEKVQIMVIMKGLELRMKIAVTEKLWCCQRENFAIAVARDDHNPVRLMDGFDDMST